MQYFKQRVFEIIEGVRSNDRASIRYEWLITSLVFLSVATLFFATFPELMASFAHLFLLVNLAVTVVFTFDFLARVWTAPLKYPHLSPSRARREYLLSPYGIIDALATFPPYLSLLGVQQVQLLKMLRLARLARLSKLKKVQEATGLFAAVFKRKKTELLMTLGVVLATVFMAGLLMYYVEHPAQPDKFTNAGAGMWWALITLTTIGYGDLYPITPLGRLLGSVIALMGIGVIALPTGILSGGMMEELEARRKKRGL